MASASPRSRGANYFRGRNGNNVNVSALASSRNVRSSTVPIFRMSELLPVPRTLGLGVMMGLEVADGTTEFQPRVQARGGLVGTGGGGFGCIGGTGFRPVAE